MSVTANVSSQPITASVSSTGTVTASVPAAAPVAASVAGGVGPQGPPGDAAGTLDQLEDVAISSPATGDVLRYSSGQWRNQSEIQLIDGGSY